MSDTESQTFCIECGTEIPDGASFCPDCGKEVGPDSGSGGAGTEIVDDGNSAEMKPLGDCAICGAEREKQRGNQEGTVQKCTECGSRWERSGGMVASRFELTDCPPEPDRAPEIKPKHEWKQIEAGESDAEKQARKGTQNVVGGLVVMGIGILLSLTVIGAVIGVPLIFVGLSMAGWGTAQSGSAKVSSAEPMGTEEAKEELSDEVTEAREKYKSAREGGIEPEDFPRIGPGMDPDQSIQSARNQTMLVLYVFTFPISIPYLIYKYRKVQSSDA